MSLVVLGFAITPGVAIAIGGALTAWINWQSCFIFLALYSLFVLYLSHRMPKTGPKPQLSALRPVQILKGYWEQLRDERLVVGSIIIGGSAGIIYIFSSKGPFIGIERLKLSPDTYGLLNLIPTAGMFLGSAISRLLPKESRLLPLVISGLLLVTLGVTAQLILFLVGEIHPWSLFVPIAIAYIGPVFPYAAISAEITANATNKSNASAVMSFLLLATATIGVLISNHFYPASALSMPVLMTAIAIVMLVLFARLRTLLGR